MSDTGECDIKYVKPLLKLASLFGQYGERKFQVNRAYRCYSSFWLAMITSAYMAVVVSKFRQRYLEEATMLVVDFLRMSFNTVLNVVAICCNSLIHADDLRSMLAKFVQTDGVLQPHLPSTKRNGSLVKELVALHVIYLTLYAYNITAWIFQARPDYVAYHFLDFVENYSGFLAVLLICNFLRSIRHRFEHLNKLLVTSVGSDFLPVKNGNGDVIDIQNLIKVYTILTDIVDLFNDIFGWQILFVIINSLLALLVPFNAVIIFIPRGDNVRIGLNYEFTFVFVATGLALLLFVGGVTIAKYAHHTHKEARRTAFLCYKLLQEMPVAGPKRRVRRKLVFLAKESSMRCPQFSAAGFFPADYTMLFTLLTSITTYLVVLIQFNR